MSFASPLWLLAGLLALPVVLAHARRQHRVEVASLRLWRLVATGATPRPRLRWPPPSARLFLQLAAVALAALAMAQPRLGTPPADHRIYLLDVSASMGARDVAPDRFTAARETLARMLATDAARVSLIAVGARAEPVIARQDAALARRRDLSGLAHGDGGADWAAAHDLARGLSRATERTDIVALSDFPDPAPADLPLRVIPFGAPTTPNAGLRASVQPLDASGRWRVRGEVVLGGLQPAPEGVGLRFGPDGGQGDLDWGWISLDPEAAVIDAQGTTRIPFAQELRFPGAGRLTLSLLPDAASHDDTLAFVLYDAPRGLSVNWIGAPEPAMERALAALGPVAITRGTTLPPDAAAGFDLVIANDTTLDRRPATNLLLLGRATIRGEDAPAAPRDGAIDGRDPSHPLLRGLDPAWPGPLRLYPHRASPDAAVLLSAGGAPVLSVRATASGQELRLGLAPDPRWTGDPAFPMLVHNLVASLGIDPRAMAGQICHAGGPCTIETRETGATVTGPDGAGLPLHGAAFTPVKTGLHRIATAGGTRLLAVHPVPEGEGDIRARPAEPLPAPPRPFWQILAACLVPVLLAEAILAARARSGFRARATALAPRGAAMAAVLAALLQLPFPHPEPARALVLVGDGAGRPARAALVDPVTGGTADPGAPMAVTPSGDAPVNIERALRLALAMLPEGREGRVHLAPPAGQTQGDMARAIPAFAARGIPIDVTPPAQVRGDTVLRQVIVPPRLHPGDTYPVTALLHSDIPRTATLRILRDGALVSERPVTIPRGPSRHQGTLEAGDPGTALIEVELAGLSDPRPANDRAGALVQVDPPASVLILTQELAAAERFAAALALQGLAPRVATPRDAPRRAEDWMAQDLVILMNLPARAFQVETLDHLAHAVRRHGTGLMILGGNRSFGPGGYYDSPLEDLSPLSSRVPHDAPVAALVFVIDRSGSMQGMVGDITRLDIAKAATLSAVDLMGEGSSIGLVVFDQEARQILPLTADPTPATVAAALGPVQPGGGTVLLPGLEQAVADLRAAQAELRHIVVMTDGLIEQTDFAPVLARAEAEGITVSTIAFGSSAITDRLALIADAGGGNYYATRDFRALPSILSEETLTLSGDLVLRDPHPVAAHDTATLPLAKLGPAWPPIAGAVRTTAKPEATRLLDLQPEGEAEPLPLMASWRQGNGQVLAFAANPASADAAAWQARADYPRLWAQLARALLPGTPRPGLAVALDRAGDRVAVTVTALDDLGFPVRGARGNAMLMDTTRTAPLTETRPGQYEAHLDLPAPGLHRIGVTLDGVTEGAALHVPYMAAQDTSADPAPALAALAAASGGQVVAAPLQPFDPGRRIVLSPLWRPWLLLALLLAVAGPVAGAARNIAARRRPVAPGAAPASPMQTDADRRNAA
ncbi:VWA domain-containing protein [Halovulum dunhuangense]|uniref:VWA domain-containing protein n=1 Tax=Halovulum dunhuangense TaxID=1505036 RepID=A0A849L0Z0_9RHOB|nr:VWA domain-containing protein [Halovulum dunhuangense]NNU79931.1 VWA domain-containing protein [Halovulum dunhuangense]